MKKSVVFISMVIIVVGMLAGFRFLVSEESYDTGQEVGKALAEMENESDDRVEKLRREIESGRLPEADCRMEIADMVEAIIENLAGMETDKGNYLNLSYNCSVIRKLGLRLEDRGDMAEAELELKRNNLSLFADKVFDYCLDATRNIEEEEDYLKLTAWAEDIEENLDQEVERYTRLVYAWYGKNGK